MITIDKITKARSILVLDHPFFGSLALRLGLVEDNSFETASTNGTDIFYNSKYIESLTTREIVGLLAHEVMHLALGHGWRQGSRKSKKWNVAADYTINENLIATGFTLPKGALNDDRYKSLSAEEIYEQLPKEQPNSKPQKGKDKGKNNDDRTDLGKCGSILPTKDEEEAKEMKAIWQAAVSQAVQLSKGALPASIEKQVQEIINPTVPWYILLRDFVEKTARNDYDWTRPSRRYIGQDIILPSLISEELPEIAIAIDTSGSINQKALSRFAAEASNVLGDYDTTVRVIYCDAKVQKEEVFTRADFPMKMKPIGGGGTNFCPVFEYIHKQHFTPACLIYFTDLCGRFPNEEPEYPTMWLTTTENKKAPFGKTVKFKN